MKLAVVLLLSCLAAQLPLPTLAQEEKGGPSGQAVKTVGADARVLDSVLGVRIGTSIEEAHAKLKDLGTVGGRATRDGGRKEAWTLKKTEFNSIAYKTDARGRVVWVTGFVREGQEIPFERLGDLTRAHASGETEVAWNVVTEEGDYRLVAKGPNRRARVVYLLSLAEGKR
ncbi:MAG TPA: hypothetical protein VFX96_15940 [Pyrinomonadaceae bacterium]|nr:hypothetical protein [Pyrinomonadaceae bacterium]